MHVWLFNVPHLQGTASLTQTQGGENVYLVDWYCLLDGHNYLLYHLLCFELGASGKQEFLKISVFRINLLHHLDVILWTLPWITQLSLYYLHWHPHWWYRRRPDQQSRCSFTGGLNHVKDLRQG